MEIIANGTKSSLQGPGAWFVGKVRIDDLFQAPQPATVSIGTVTFEPGARTAWHSHPLGQTLIVTKGIGWIQVDGGSIREICSGDIVWISPGEKHWHGATTNTAMTHIAIQEAVNGQAAEWFEQVSEQDYIGNTTF